MQRSLERTIRKSIKRALPAYRFYCPVCDNYARAFLPATPEPRPNCICPNCGSRERHRLTWLFLNRHSDLFDGRPKRMLHVAAERSLARRLSRVPGLAYLTADLSSPTAMLQMDIMDIQFPEDSFDVILCSHVLEHVDDDRQAMREFARVLKPGGWALLLVPISVEATFEDPSITDPALRKRLFGHPEHVRQYGMDFADRLAEAGLVVRVFRPVDVAAPADLDRAAILPSEWPLFYCVKPPAVAEPPRAE
jgi:SAM-dependent methyltransferase